MSSDHSHPVHAQAPSIVHEQPRKPDQSEYKNQGLHVDLDDGAAHKHADHLSESAHIHLAKEVDSPQLKPADQPRNSGSSVSRVSRDTNDIPHQLDLDVRKSPQLRSNSASVLPAAGSAPLVVHVSDTKSTQKTTTILAGAKLIAFHVDTPTLLAESPYFTNLAMFNDESAQHHPDLSSPHTKKADTNPLSGPFSFPEFDEFSVALFTRWLHDEHSLHGPHDFHSLNHYLCLYALAKRFGIEKLENQVMDVVRHYYHQESMTAPPFRLEYIYTNTSGPNKMKEFLVTTAAYRVLSKGLPESDSVGYTFKQTEPVSDSLNGVLRGGGDVAPDFVDKLVLLHKNELEDPRKGDDCRWHEHSDGPFGTDKCQAFGGYEAYESH